MKFIKHVSWRDIKEAEREGDKLMEFELTDILESAKLTTKEIDDKIKENIEYILKREGIYDPEKMSVVVPPLALHWECDEKEGSCFFTADFEVFDETGNKILARGTAYASGLYFPKDLETELLDMTVAMPTRYVKRLKRIVETLKHVIWGVGNEVR